ncbi:MAG: extracellular solute-binding protein [Sporichthyaceae bacterium]|nr:extracellular solute-binding protein [Sporichthyaceae bacterium]
MTLHPNIKITHQHTGDGGPYHEALFTQLAANAGLADVVAVEEGHIGRVMPFADKFADLNQIGPDTSGRWLPWKTARATTADGKLIGYGTDVGPLAICYRKDLFESAGLPSAPAEVAPLFATWDSYFAAGKDFTANSDAAWFDSATQIFNAMVNQLPVGFSDRSNNLVIETNPDIRASWNQVTQAVTDGLSAKLPAWGDEWTAGFQNGAFATQACPSWMLGVITERSGPDNAGKWAVADAFPNGGGNWGGAWLTVPSSGDHQTEAAELAAWLTAPEQQIKAFQASGTFPSQLQALSNPTLLSTTNEYFGGQEVGALFAARAQAITEAQWKGPNDGPIQENASSPAPQAVEQGASPEEGSQQFVEEAKRIVG